MPFMNERRLRIYRLSREHFERIRDGYLAPRFSELPPDITPVQVSTVYFWMTSEIAILATSESFPETSESAPLDVVALPLDVVTAEFHWPSALAERAWRRPTLDGPVNR
ncbi:MAG TPA: hypothetical protein VN719_09665 [Gemmatimonadales bacterium]|nr:hypothetical protein [Gemmatimonadales bacterium]